MPSTIAPGVIDAVSRSVEIERDGATVSLITRLGTSLGAAPVELWPVLTDPERLARWYGPVEIDRADGAARTFRAVGGAHGRVVEVDPPHHLQLTWEYGTNVDSLELRLDPQDDGTSALRLIQTTRLPAEVFDAYGPGATALGWDIALLGLVAHTDAWQELRLAPTAPTPAWLQSEEGRDHVRAWSIRWAAASAAAGTDVDAARRAEIETTRAYGAQADAVPA